MPVRRRHFDQLVTAQSWSSPAAVIAHIDLDAFYAQCLCVHNNYDPKEPLGCRQWNSLIAVNYPAREFGIKRGASVDEARKLCPEIHLPHVATFKKGELDWDFHPAPEANEYKVSLDYFRRESRRIFAVFKQHFSLVEKAGIDEGFVDLGKEVHSEALKRVPDLLANKAPDDILDISKDQLIEIGAELVNSVRQQIYSDLHYTCSAGVARNKLLAKLGSGFKKPFNQTIVYTSEIPDFLKHFKVTDAWGWGGKQGKLVLADLGISDDTEDQCGYVRENFSFQELRTKLKGNARLARNLYEMVRGEHQSEVHSRTLIKSMVAVKDFRRLNHLNTRDDVEQWLRVFSADLSGRLADLHEDLGSVIVPKTVAVRQDRTNEGSQSKQQPFTLRGTSIPQLREQIFEQSKAMADVFIQLPCTYLVVEISHFNELPKERLMFTPVSKPELSPKKELPKDRDSFRSTSSPEQPVSPHKQTVLAQTQGSSANLPFKQPQTPEPEVQELADDADESLFVDDLWRCVKCGKQLPEHEQQEHEDWHFAMELQNGPPTLPKKSTLQQRSPQSRRPTSGPSKDSKKRKKSSDAHQKNILDFFKK